MPCTHKVNIGNKITQVSELALQDSRRTSDKVEMVQQVAPVALFST